MEEEGLKNKLKDNGRVDQVKKSIPEKKGKKDDKKPKNSLINKPKRPESPTPMTANPKSKNANKKELISYRLANATFQNLIKDIAREVNPSIKFTRESMFILKGMSEMFMMNVLSKSY
jgi:hypothetical protein